MEYEAAVEEFRKAAMRRGCRISFKVSPPGLAGDDPQTMSVKLQGSWHQVGEVVENEVDSEAVRYLIARYIYGDATGVSNGG